MHVIKARVCPAFTFHPPNPLSSILGLPLLHWWEEEHRHSEPFKQPGHKYSRIEPTNGSLSTAQTISSGKVKVDLIFCLVLIKQLLHYLISHNQVKGGGSNQYMSTKSF